ncbi:ABC transporter permease [Bradyrhizobium sp. AUGA SZCCT0182]|uniref:ABC transporter permease n=1 Tax=Bradyrhizobium sp. AUGA SZCCT0182 TaxID=2807667 RepID=UPI001BADD420|nr:ABC transporter permease [Bradyrhizobium sp. AUGA SZCCT0182]MBR1232025.1 ABC transporter permease [Bradyrhizobium sp. AUGA SZCCT0182]
MKAASSGKRPSAGTRSLGADSSVSVVWGSRVLIRRLAARELQARYRGSMLGIAWAVIVPLGMVLMYTFVFGSIFKVRWSGISGSTESMTAFFLAGLIVHQFLSEVIARAPSLVLENKNYVTRVVFPLEILSLVTVAVALVGAAIGLALLLCLLALTSGIPPATVLLSPLVLLGMVPMLLGLTWIFSAIGVFVRDLGQIMPVALSVLFFLAPVLYPRSSVPPPFDALVLFNPTTIPIEAMRALVFEHPFPWELALSYFVISLVVCWTGFSVFLRLRRAFADVL